MRNKNKEIGLFSRLAAILYERYDPSMLQRKNITTSEMIIRLFAGFTEPDNISWFSKKSAGIYWLGLRLKSYCPNAYQFESKFRDSLGSK